jgi:hypothetical protein
MTGASAATASLPRRSYGRAIAFVAAALGTVLMTLLIAGLVWARGYEPLDASGGEVTWTDHERGTDVDPAPGSDGKPVYFPRYRRNGTFAIAFTVTNTGRFAVELDGLPREPRVGVLFLPIKLAVFDKWYTWDADPSPVDARRPLHIAAGATQTLRVDYRIVGRCSGGGGTSERADGYASTDVIRLRYRYLRVFERTATLELPMALTLACRGDRLDAFSG